MPIEQRRQIFKQELEMLREKKAHTENGLHSDKQRIRSTCATGYSEGVSGSYVKRKRGRGTSPSYGPFT